MSNLFQDVRYGLRMMMKRPGFTLIAVITLALGIGANTAIFSVVNLLIVNPLPFKDGQRIVHLWRTSPRFAGFRVSPSQEMFDYWRQHANSFEGMEPFTTRNATLTGVDEPESIMAQLISPTLISFLGASVAPQIGRSFIPDDARPDAERVVMISDGLWKRRFGGDPQIIGRQVMLNDESYTVIGVMPRFRIIFFGHYELWMPLALEAVQPGSPPRAVNVMARLKPGVTPQAAQAELDVLSAQLEQENPKLKGWRGLVITPQENVPSNVKTALPIFFAAAGFVLLIACANIANLLMARNNARSKEMAIRLALGAGRFRLIRQLLSESLLLALAGGGLGVLLALWSIDLIRNTRPDTILQLDYLEFSREALLFNMALAILTGLIFGLGPALQASRIDLNQALKQGARSIFNFSRQRFVRGSLVAGQMALALVLLIGAGLLIRAMIRLQNVERGFDSNDLTTMLINLPESRYKAPTSQEQFFEDLLTGIRGMPGVEGAALASEVPPDTGLWTGQFEIEGKTLDDSERPQFFGGGFFGTGYFRLMGIPVLEGRAFIDEDDSKSPNVVIVNEKTAGRFWPDESAVGKRFRFGPQEEWMTIVGVVGDVKVGSLESDKFSLQAYFPFKREPIPAMHVVVRSKLDTAQLITALKSRVWSLDRDLPVKGIETMEEKFAASLSRQRFNTLLLIIFAGVAMTLAAVGIYGVMSYTVSQRTQEIGIRMALGAQQGEVLKLIVKQGMTLSLIGVVAGLAAAFALTRVMESLLFGVSATDPLTFAGISLLLTSVALMACWLPARRAARIDPMVALRYE